MEVKDNPNQNINHHIRPFRDRKLGQIESFNLVMYKYIQLEFVLKMLETKVLRLDNIKKWEDVYENFVDKEDINLLNSSREEMIPTVYYGQSWTIREESDAMWRIYSNTGSAVRVKTVYPLLYCALADWNKKYKDDIIWPTIDYVNYADEDEINRWLQSNSPMNYWAFGELQREGLFVKRREFEHEKEVRVIMQTHKEEKDYIEIDFDPYKVFREIVIDPRVSEDEFTRQRDNLIARGFDGNKIKKSTLYDFKRVRLEIDMSEPCDFEIEYYSKKEDKVKKETVYMNAPR
jgi:hypothetical protein